MPPSRVVERLLLVMEAGLRATSGDVGAAKALLDRADDSSARAAEVAVALAGLQLAGGDPAAAAATLAPYLNGLASTFSLALLLQAWLLDALAARAVDDDKRVFRSLERALVLAEQEGFRLAFTRAGSGVRALLADQLVRGTAHGRLVVELLEALEAAPSPTPPAPAAGPARTALVEPLSERERIVLRYLGGVLSNMEIASELYVSVNTVKTHLRSIYRKLDVTGRRAAVRRARELRLL